MLGGYSSNLDETWTANENDKIKLVYWVRYPV